MIEKFIIDDKGNLVKKLYKNSKYELQVAHGVIYALLLISEQIIIINTGSGLGRGGLYLAESNPRYFMNPLVSMSRADALTNLAMHFGNKPP